MPDVAWQTARVPNDYDLLAPDGSEIRLLVSGRGGSMVHCVVRPGQVTLAVRHRSVEELWFCVSGTGQLWRSWAGEEEIVELVEGVALSIPVGAAFQFRATGNEPLQVVITTLPAWPGPDEADAVNGLWEPTGE
jgi:mannose-6-phosphate isomerase-like protein (cupin superfamily)